jgi:hypothetical protein
MSYQEFRALFPTMTTVDTGANGQAALNLQVRPGCYVLVADLGHVPDEESDTIDVSLYQDDRGVGGHYPADFAVVSTFEEAAEEIHQWMIQEVA